MFLIGSERELDSIVRDEIVQWMFENERTLKSLLFFLQDILIWLFGKFNSNYYTEHQWQKYSADKSKNPK